MRHISSGVLEDPVRVQPFKPYLRQMDCVHLPALHNWVPLLHAVMLSLCSDGGQAPLRPLGRPSVKVRFAGHKPMTHTPMYLLSFCPYQVCAVRVPRTRV